MEISKEKMYEITGGVSWQVVGIIGAAITYIIGIFSGFTNPNRCHN